jgi:hypothetical protein
MVRRSSQLRHHNLAHPFAVNANGRIYRWIKQSLHAAQNHASAMRLSLCLELAGISMMKCLCRNFWAFRLHRAAI